MSIAATFEAPNRSAAPSAAGVRSGWPAATSSAKNHSATTPAPTRPVMTPWVRSGWPLSALRGHPLLTQGVITGLVGAGVVALWFFALDVAAGHPLRTPAALGAALLFGASNVAAIDITFGLVAAYSVVHVAAFVMAGALFVAIAEQIERTPALMLVALMAMIVLDAVVGATLALGAQWVLGTLGVWSVLVANVLAVCAMGWYVWATHPVLRRRLHEEVQVNV